MSVAAEPVWRPSAQRIGSARMTAFRRLAGERRGAPFANYQALHEYSVSDLEGFWRAVWDFCGVRGDPGSRVVVDGQKMPGARFFPDARLNFTENILYRSDDQPAIIAETESGARRTITWAELAADVYRASRALESAGVQPGDRVCGIVANIPEAIVAALAAAAIGAVWSSCSPDFGVQGVLDRFGQIDPKVLISIDGYEYAGKRHDCLGKLRDVVKALPRLARVVVVSMETRREPTTAGIRDAATWNDWLAPHSSAPRAFARLPFAQPLYILYSSGTTGVPKCIVHGAGGTLLQHLKEHQLCCDIKAGDRVFYFTTCGWMMWNWLVTALASGAALVLYDGSPFHPDGNRLFDLADRSAMTLFGTSAKFIDAVHKANLEPKRTHQLGSVRTMTSTGSPLAPESFDYVYQAIRSDIHLASISGGTDIVSCFVGGDPTRPVWRGEIQGAALGMDVDVFGPDGRSLRAVDGESEPGELVCKRPFPSMPLGFWNDPDGAKYHAAYFEKFPGVWWHGDWIRFTSHDGVIIFGRSDATLKPGGVRIGTAEIYREVEQLPEVLESLAVGQHWENDERIILFVRLAPHTTLDDGLRKRIVDRIRRNTSPRHVPARIIQVTDIPRTKSGKIVELAVRSVIHGREVTNREALANPEALDLYRNLPELQQ